MNSCGVVVDYPFGRKPGVDARDHSFVLTDIKSSESMDGSDGPGLAK